MKRVEANDAASIYALGSYYDHGERGVLQNREKAIDFYTRAADLGSSKAHYNLGAVYYEGGDMKKAKFHYEATAMAGHEMARFNLGIHEYNSGNIERAAKHWTIAASTENYIAMHELRAFFEREGGNYYGKRIVSRESIDSTLEAYNNSCVKMKSEARDIYIRVIMLGGGQIYDSHKHC
jgi:TPR repeat protein